MRMSWKWGAGKTPTWRCPARLWRGEVGLGGADKIHVLKGRNKRHDGDHGDRGQTLGNVHLERWALCPLRTSGNVWRYFWLLQLGLAGSYRHLVGTAQGCCWTSHNAQGSLQEQRLIQHKMSTGSRLRNSILSRVRAETKNKHFWYICHILTH